MLLIVLKRDHGLGLILSTQFTKSVYSTKFTKSIRLFQFALKLKAVRH